jgi:hypothetical protein
MGNHQYHDPSYLLSFLGIPPFSAAFAVEKGE